MLGVISPNYRSAITVATDDEGHRITGSMILPVGVLTEWRAHLARERLVRANLGMKAESGLG